MWVLWICVMLSQHWGTVCKDNKLRGQKYDIGEGCFQQIPM